MVSIKAMCSQRFFFCFLILTTVFSSGCVPLYLKTRPALDIRVQDQKGEPIPRSRLHLVTRAMPHARLIREERYPARNDGTIETSSQRQWELMMFMIHGVNSYYWEVCIEAAGFQQKKGRLWGNELELENTGEKITMSGETTFKLVASGKKDSCTAVDD